jgi:3-deoxy-D-manno-octulosonic-acid transferase
VPPDVVTVTGDPRHDQVIERVARPKLRKPLRDWSLERVVLVAGSVDDLDARVLFDAFKQVSRSFSSAGLVLVPHDPSERNVAELASIAAQRGVSVHVWREGSVAPETSCLIIARLGVLIETYLNADIAYVGGGFRKGTLHATIEPAAFALPVIMGPEYRSSADAERLLQQGGAVALSRRGPADTCHSAWREWIESAQSRTDSGLRARRTLQQGAAGATAEVLVKLLG